jgi:hypothetical protein
MSLSIDCFTGNSITLRIDKDIVLSISAVEPIDGFDPVLSVELHREGSKQIQVSRLIERNDLFAWLNLLPTKNSPECTFARVHIPKVGP